MRLEKGQHLYTAEMKNLGKIERVVLDPQTGEVSHVVISKGLLFPHERVVSSELIVSASDQGLILAAGADVEGFPPFEIEKTVPLDEETRTRYGTYEDPVFWYGIPAAGYGRPLAMGTYSHTVAVQRNVPENAAAVTVGAKVLDVTGKSVGTIEEVRVDDRDGTVAALITSRDMLSTDRKLIPAEWVQSWGEDEVSLLVSATMVGQLPPSMN